MKQKLLSAALGILVVVAPHTVVAQDLRSPGDSAKMKPLHEFSQVSKDRLRRLKVHGPESEDPNKNGVIIGAAIGGALGAFLGAGLASINESGDGFAGPVIVMAALGAGGGGAIGYAVDKAIHKQVTYRIPLSRNVALQPSVGLDRRPGQAAAGARAGLNAAVRW